ncbi:lipopolysaccharide heptosyltransferase II [Enterovibrio norvegicus]|uniref:lipopolysaccharide heptosyltransferase II n=1 Tax=Enterovibrio norvegicus TaxID=188144 RepID=A0A2N7LEA2_9GAMM|nr:lipopolysaccharide heptosyltransferase II [Enterovibrio norvegicus]PML79735.1 lipopolysaccharide heptosyltransferase II [Enterovibrio norvegicus]PMN69837.1 lipopolysaccharide heptosyltransferase II [Enterovibrio norvegicus]PMN93742.1 lipopolysaccharide heptosyltransferase II [Enterovibrio norvegicus]
MKKILIIGPAWVGDMVMSQTLYIELKKHNPDSEIDVMAPDWCRPILERMPEVDKVIAMPLGHGEFSLSARRRLGIALRSNDYEHAYILPNSAKSALIPWFANIPNRTGWRGEMRYGLLNDLRPNKKDFSLMIERYVALAHSRKEMLNSKSLKSLPRPKLAIDKNKQQQALDRFQLQLNRPVIGLCTGAEFGPAKRWPEYHFSETARQLIDKGYQIWLFGSAKDREVTSQIKSSLDAEQQVHCVNLAGETSLIEAIDLLAACGTVVSNDSGLMHIAASVGCRLVALYGSTSPSYTPPLAEHVAILHTDIECRPCFERECPKQHLKCLTELKPDQVLSEVIKLNAIQVETC